MVKKVSFSGKNLILDDIAAYYSDTEKSLRLYFSPTNPKFEQRFLGYTPEDLTDELKNRIDELGRTTSLSLLATLEAVFRIDYITRCEKRKKDTISKELRVIYQQKITRASLEEDILNIWKENTSSDTSKLISDLKRAYKFRHWLAHGRYWTLKIGRPKSEYDYSEIYELAKAILDNFPFEGV